jgi:tryptophan-rich sensory protein
VNRRLALKVALIVVGLLFLALIYPMALFMRREPALSMMLSLYVTLGVFLLMAVRDTSAHRSLILFTAWSSFAHAVVMGYQSVLGMVARGELAGVAVLIAIGVVLLVLVPRKEGAAHVPAQPLPIASRS